MEYEILKSSASGLYTPDGIERANVDVQVTTAKSFPRDIKSAINNAIVIATMDKDVAGACSYALPRGGKPIIGPSVHLARILAQCYGNMRAESKVIEITDTQVVSRGTAWDLENNYAAAFEVRRSITDKKGQRYNGDMITVTGNAANAIAYRNAVLSVIPKSITDKVYRAAQEAVTGDLSDETKLIARRTKAIDYFQSEYGITEPEILKLVGKHTVNQLGVEEIALLVGFQQSLKDGDTTVEELLKNVRTKADILKNIEKESQKENLAKSETTKKSLL
jgi:hypothetical protein